MTRRVSIFIVALFLAASMSFGASNGCANYDCLYDQFSGNEYCASSPDGGGSYSGCTTIRQCMSGGGCITYCSWTSCQWV
jgi:hypothetical protein